MNAYFVLKMLNSFYVRIVFRVCQWNPLTVPNYLLLPCASLSFLSLPLQIVVNNVHFRYEDSEACPSSPFAVGVTVENISAQTTNDQWVSTEARIPV